MWVDNILRARGPLANKFQFRAKLRAGTVFGPPGCAKAMHIERTSSGSQIHRRQGMPSATPLR